MALNGHAATPKNSGMKRSHSSDPPRAHKRPSSSEGKPQVTPRAVGQLAPRLLYIIKTADRAHRVPDERNPFTDPPYGFDKQFDQSRRQPLYPPCKHVWTTQRNQTVLPESDITDPDGVYRLACFCQTCHWHVDLEIQHTAQPCPKRGYADDEYPLHHFTNFEREREEHEWYKTRCSGCAAILRINYRRPRLRTDAINSMTDEARLRAKLVRAQQADPERNHTKPAAPIEVLDALATYLKDAFASTEEKKIPKANRRFVTSFGEESKDFLLDMGFTDGGDYYALPRPPPPDPWAWSLRKQLEDTQEELWALMRTLKESDPSISIENRKGYNPSMEPFDEDAQLFLSTFEYDKSKIVRRMPNMTLDEQSWYAGLGCLGDMSDDLIAFGFDRQIATDRDNMPYYYDCLANLAKKRNSESLDMKLALLASEGYYGRQDVISAYRYFTLDYRQASELTDEYIQGVFESRMANISKVGEAEAREKLRLIGTARGSALLLEAASDELTDHTSALRFLDSNYSEHNQYPDDTIIALAAVKASDVDSKSQQEKVNKAVRLIAEHRNSVVLHAYLATGEAATTDEDDLTAAYRFFDIKDRSSPIDFDILNLMVRGITEEESQDRKDKAIRYLSLLQNKHSSATLEVEEMPDYTKPVGLRNTRNYCYFHALLQFLYAIKPFRDVVLRFEDEFQQEISTASTENLGKVAGSQITKPQVEDGHKLVPLLSALFRRLEEAPGPWITAPDNVAAEALNPPPSNAPSNQDSNVDAEKSDPTDAATPNSDSSDVTLVGDVLTPASDTEDMQTQEPASSDPQAETGNLPEAGDGKPSPPSHPPPPVPPRPTTFVPVDESEKQYLQQDAHEVLSKLIVRSAAAIKPDNIDNDGERHDVIRDLFFITSQLICTEDSKVKTEPRTEHAINLFLHLQKKPKDVQEALDIEFGRQEIENSVEGSQSSTARYGILKEAPKVLQLYVNRFRHNPGTNKAEVVPHRMELNDVIYLDRYLEKQQSEMLPLRQEAWRLHDRIIELEDQRQHLKVPEILVYSKDKGNNVKEDFEFHDSLNTVMNTIDHDIADDPTNNQEAIDLKENIRVLSEDEQKRIEEIDATIPKIRAELDSLPLNQCDSSGMKYHLFAVFLYNGTTESGHWMISIRDFNSDLWRVYNDQYVTNSTFDDLCSRLSEERSHAPLIAYVRDDEKDRIIDPVHRIEPEGDGKVDIDGDVMMDKEQQNPWRAAYAECEETLFQHDLALINDRKEYSQIKRLMDVYFSDSLFDENTTEAMLFKTLDTISQTLSEPLRNLRSIEWFRYVDILYMQWRTLDRGLWPCRPLDNEIMDGTEDGRDAYWEEQLTRDVPGQVEDAVIEIAIMESIESENKLRKEKRDSPMDGFEEEKEDSGYSPDSSESSVSSTSARHHFRPKTRRGHRKEEDGPYSRAQ